MVEEVHKFSSHCPSVCFATRKEEKSMRVEEKHIFLFSTIYTPPIFKAHNFLISSSF
jgi:hypothetical protein